MDGNAGRVGEVFAGAVSGQGFTRRQDQMCCDGCLLWLPGGKNTNEHLVLQTLHLTDQTPLMLLKERRNFTKEDRRQTKWHIMLTWSKGLPWSLIRGYIRFGQYCSYSYSSSSFPYPHFSQKTIDR